MVIDFHTHTFPDKIAERTIALLSANTNSPAYRDGTVASLIESMRKTGVDYSVVLPVATSPKQVPSINRLSYELNGRDHLYYSGAIHPDCENVEEILDEIKAHGLFGIKLHPDYQGVHFDDPRYVRILAEAARRDLIIVTHAGLDVGFPDHIHCTPDHILHVWEQIGDLLSGKLVLAHMGSCDHPEEAMDKLCGLDVYFDTAFVLNRYPEKCRELILAHGTDRILFASDSPWADPKLFLEILRSMELSREDEEKILFRNAQRLLSLV